MTTLTNTLSEVAQHLRLGRMTIYRPIRSGDLPSILTGGSRRIAADALAGYLNAIGSR